MMGRTEIHEVVAALAARFPHARLTGEWTQRVTNAVTETERLRAQLS
jgi:cytochrome P450